MSLDKPHFCNDWDFMLVVPGAPEMQGCTCDENTPMLGRGDKVKTDFVRDEADKVRIVQDCYQSDIKSQTGWWVKVDGLGQLDSGWFREI